MLIETTEERTIRKTSKSSGEKIKIVSNCQRVRVLSCELTAAHALGCGICEVEKFKANLVRKV